MNTEGGSGIDNKDIFTICVVAIGAVIMFSDVVETGIKKWANRAVNDNKKEHSR